MRGVLIIILTLVFLYLLYYSFQFTMNPFSSESGTGVTEGFSSAPTRATDCNCLPGYIPSSSSNGYGGKIFTFKQGDGSYYLYNPSGTSDVYSINPGNDTCGLPTSGDFPTKSWDELFSQNSKYRHKGFLKCDVVTKNTNTANTFFCQSLSNSSRTRACY